MPRLHRDEVAVDIALVATLVVDQFPQWAGLPLRRVPSTGTDNVVFRLGRHLAVRLPRIHWAVAQVDREWSWLPRLAPDLPAAVPVPVARGAPAAGYPYPWLVSRWVHGRDATAVPVRDRGALAGEVARFAAVLHGLDTAGAPAAGRRGGPLGAADAGTRVAIARLGDAVDAVDAARATAVWEDALAAGPWTGAPVWVHGDLLPGNVVARGGTLAGVIDWSACGAGDPACDAMLAWWLPPGERARFRDALGLDDAAWRRGRGWALEQAAWFIPYYARTLPAAVAAARERLDAVLEEDGP